MNKIRITLISFLILISLAGCTSNRNKVKFENKNYVNFENDEQVKQKKGNICVHICANGQLLYGEAEITGKSFGFVNKVVGLEMQKEVIRKIAVEDKNKIYCMLSNMNGTKFGDKIYVVKQDEIMKTIQMKDGFGVSKIINHKDEMYIQGCVRPANIYPDGVPFVMMDSKRNKQIGEFFVKGIVSAGVTYNEDTYMIVTLAKVIGYEGFHDSYIAKLNHSTKQIEILNDDLEAHYAGSMAISRDGMICIVDTSSFSKKAKVSHLFMYDLKGNLVDKYDLDNWADKIVINDQNIAYISHRGKNQMFDDSGNVITVFDLNQRKVVDKITVDKGPSDLYLFENYLFVSTFATSSIEAISMEKNEVIGRAKIDDLYKINQVIVTSNER